jgi:flagellar motor switch protein FliN
MTIDTPLSNVKVELSIVLGEAKMPIHQLLRMGHGAVIELPNAQNDEVMVFAGEVQVAKASVMISENVIAIEIKELMRKPTILRERRGEGAPEVFDIPAAPALDEEMEAEASPEAPVQAEADGDDDGDETDKVFI